MCKLTGHRRLQRNELKGLVERRWPPVILGIYCKRHKIVVLAVVDVIIILAHNTYYHCEPSLGHFPIERLNILYMNLYNCLYVIVSFYWMTGVKLKTLHVCVVFSRTIKNVNFNFFFKLDYLLVCLS